MLVSRVTSPTFRYLLNGSTEMLSIVDVMFPLSPVLDDHARPAVTRSSLYLRRYRYSTRSPSVVGPWPFRLPTNSKPPHAVKNRYSRRGVWMEADR